MVSWLCTIDIHKTMVWLRLLGYCWDSGDKVVNLGVTISLRFFGETTESQEKKFNFTSDKGWIGIAVSSEPWVDVPMKYDWILNGCLGGLPTDKSWTANEIVYFFNGKLWIFRKNHVLLWFDQQLRLDWTWTDQWVMIWSNTWKIQVYTWWIIK